MKTLYVFCVLILLIVLLVKCTDEEVGSRDWPRLNTLPVTDINYDGGVRFNARLIYRGDFEILRYGFVWSKAFKPVLENCDRKIISGNLNEETFSAWISTTLKGPDEYSVRSFVETKDFTVYGNEIRFQPEGSCAPTILSVEPLSGTFGDTVYIKGENFSYIPQTNIVRFENPPVISSGTSNAEIIYTSDTLLVVKVPWIQWETSVRVTVTILAWKATSKEVFSITR